MGLSLLKGVNDMLKLLQFIDRVAAIIKYAIARMSFECLKAA